MQNSQRPWVLTSEATSLHPWQKLGTLITKGWYTSPIESTELEPWRRPIAILLQEYYWYTGPVVVQQWVGTFVLW